MTLRTLIVAFAASLLTATSAFGFGSATSDLVVTVSPALAQPGQPVMVTLHNQSTSTTYDLPTPCVFQSVHPGACDTDPIYDITCPAFTLPVAPGQTVNQQWMQDDTAGNQVADGGYYFNIVTKDPSGATVALCPFVQIGFTCSVPPNHYGAGSVGSGDKTPAISPIGSLPAIGSTDFQVAVTNALGGAGALYVVGFAPASVPVSWGTFLVDPSLPLFVVPTSLGGTIDAPGEGIGFLPVPVPNDVSLLGFEVYFQCLVADPGSVGGVAATEGLRAVICQ